MSNTIKVALEKNMTWAVCYRATDPLDHDGCMGVYTNPLAKNARIEFYQTHMKVCQEDGTAQHIFYKNIINTKLANEGKHKLDVDTVNIKTDHQDYAIKITGKKGNRRDVYIFQTFLLKIIRLKNTGNLD